MSMKLEHSNQEYEQVHNCFTSSNQQSSFRYFAKDLSSILSALYHLYLFLVFQVRYKVSIHPGSRVHLQASSLVINDVSATEIKLID